MNDKIRRVGLLQMACSDDSRENLETVSRMIRAAAKQGAEIISTQELFRSKYFCQCQDPSVYDLAEPIPGESTQRLQELARELNVVIIGSLFEKRAPGVYHNTAAIIDAGGEMLGIYRKMHIPDDPLYYEKYYFTPGDTGFKTWHTKKGKIGVLICWDQWFPEGARLTALSGAEILFYPTAIGWHEKEKDEFGVAQHDAWETIQRAHAIANGVYVCATNRIGRESTVQFWGQSFIADPFGRVLYRASDNKEEVIVRELDMSALEETRRNWPFLRDRRIDAYGDLKERFLK